MKITIELNSTRILILSGVLIFLLVAGFTQAQRTRTPTPEEQPGIAVQFVSGFVCMFTQCGWPALVLLVLPAIAVYVWKKYISLG